MEVAGNLSLTVPVAAVYESTDAVRLLNWKIGSSLARRPDSTS